MATISLGFRLQERHWLALIYGIALVAELVLFWQVRVPTIFSATLNTTSISFTVGHLPDPGGIFNSPVNRVDVTLHTHCEIKSNGSVITQDTGDALLLQNVRIQALGAGEGSHVSLAVIDGFLRIKLEPAIGKSDAFLTVQLDENSKVPGNRRVQQARNSECSIRPAKGDGPLELSIHFLQNLPDTERVPLRDGERISFNRNGECGIILGPDDEIVMRKHSMPVDSDLKLNHLQNATIEELALRLAPKSELSSPSPVRQTNAARPYALRLGFLNVKVTGESDDILLVSSAKRSELAPTLLIWLWPANLASRLAGIGAMLGACLIAWKEFSGRGRRAKRTRKAREMAARR